MKQEFDIKCRVKSCCGRRGQASKDESGPPILREPPHPEHRRFLTTDAGLLGNIKVFCDLDNSGFALADHHDHVTAELFEEEL